MNLTNKTIESTYDSLVTIGTDESNPNKSTLQNGNGEDLESLVFNEIQVTKLIQTQASVAANGTTLSAGTVLTAGVNLVTSADASNTSVRLPQPQLGLVVNIVNTSSRAIMLYPYSETDSVLGLNDGEGYSIPADGQLYRVVCIQNPSVGVWSVSTPTSMNSVSKTVSINLTADGTYFSGVTGESLSSSELVEASTTTYYPSTGSVSILDAPSQSSNWFDAPEFNNYNKVRIKNLIVKSNVPAGNLTSAGSQNSSVLMGISYNQIFQLFGFMRVAYLVGGQQYTINEYNTYRFLDSYSYKVDNGLTTNYVSHYMGVDGNLYQQLNINTPNSDWRFTKDSNGNRSVYFGPYIGYGSLSEPSTGFPANFSFEAELIAEFEFSM